MFDSSFRFARQFEQRGSSILTVAVTTCVRSVYSEGQPYTAILKAQITTNLAENLSDSFCSLTTKLLPRWILGFVTEFRLCNRAENSVHKKHKYQVMRAKGSLSGEGSSKWALRHCKQVAACH